MDAAPRFTNARIDWYRSPISRERLRELMVREDLRGWIQTLAHLGLFFATGTICFLIQQQIALTNWFWSVPLLLLGLFVHGTIGPFMGLIAIHELQHRTVFKTAWLNHFFEKFYAFLSWSDYIWYQESHALHHQSTCFSEHDGEVPLPLRFSVRKWRNWLNWLAFDPRTWWERMKLISRHARGDIRGEWYNYVLPKEAPELRRRHRNWARILLAGHGVLATIFLVTGNWFLIVVFTFGTFYCSWLGLLMGRPQHYGLNPNIPDFRMNTRTFTCSWLPAFYYWNMQYHLEHHMYPAVPFYNIGKLRKELEPDLPKTTHGVIATWKDLLKLRRKCIADPSFVYVPECPQAPEVASFAN